MVVMAAKWSGKCRRCGKAIVQGTPMDWEKGTGAVHVSQADCDRASEVMPTALRGPVPEDPEKRKLIMERLLGHPWKADIGGVQEAAARVLASERLGRLGVR
jgi:hypothetical protein